MFNDFNWVSISGGKLLGEDFYLQHCGPHGFVLRLLPGKVWGNQGSTLNILQYGSSGAINVQIAKVIQAFDGSISPTLTLLHEHQRIVTITGENLKPAGAVDQDVTVLFSMQPASTYPPSVFRGTVVPGSYTGLCYTRMFGVIEH